MNSYFYYVPFVIQNLFFVIFLPLYKFFLRLEIQGIENLKNLKGPIIIAPNHTSELDPTAIPLIFPFLSSLLPIYSVTYPFEKYKTKEWKWRRYIYSKFFFNILGGYSTYSGYRDYKKSLKEHTTLLRQGRTVCIFPEGKCTLDGFINRAHGGMGFLLHETNATVIPLVINTFYGLKFSDFIFRRKKIILKILPPLSKFDLVNTTSPKVSDYQRASQLVMDRIKEEMYK